MVNRNSVKNTVRAAGTALLAASLLVVAGCGDDEPGAGDPDDILDPSVSEVLIEVDYEDGAEPYVEEQYLVPPSTKRSFDRLSANVSRLFQESGAVVNIPVQLDQMENIGAVDGESFSTRDILNIAGSHRDERDETGRATFYVVYLDGYFHDGDGENRNVIGVSIGRTGVVAMFKPVLRGLGSTDQQRSRAEQATLIHEIGHAVGLVNNPIPPQSDHHDEEHGAHCSNTDCVMYWTNEGADALATFVTGPLLDDTDAILFDDACIEDIDAVSSE